MKFLISGMTGAAALTAAHKFTRRTRSDAPRMDVLGEQGLAKVAHRTGIDARPDSRLFRAATFAADLASNALVYSLAGTNRHSPKRGLVLGAAMGAGALLLPGPLGLSVAAARRTKTTAMLTFGLYTLGGVVAGGVGRALARERRAG